VITVAVRRYRRYGLSYRDVEELLAERGAAVDLPPRRVDVPTDHCFESAVAGALGQQNASKPSSLSSPARQSTAA
jgi:hypothetical protein